MINNELVLMVMGMVGMTMAFMAGSKYSARKSRRAFNKAKREEQRARLSAMPEDYLEELEVALEEDHSIFAENNLTLAVLMATTINGTEVIVDKDFRDANGTTRELDYYDKKHRESVNSIFEDVDAVKVIHEKLNGTESMDIERYRAFNDTVIDIERGRHWFSGNVIAAYKVLFVDINYCELLTILNPQDRLAYKGLDPEFDARTKTDKLFNKVNDTINNAEDSLDRINSSHRKLEASINDVVRTSKNTAKALAREFNSKIEHMAGAIGTEIYSICFYDHNNDEGVVSCTVN